MTQFGRLILGLVLLCLCLSAGAEITSYVRVRDDGALLIRRHIIWLYGVYIPTTDRTCKTLISPRRCGPRAILELDFKINGFVTCEPVYTNADDSLSAVCRHRGQDLAAWMLEQGWALALPDAPFEYAALEQIARSRKVGVWGTPADRIQRR